VKSHPTIYFVQADPPDGPVKIGFTGRRVVHRMAEGQTFAPKELTLLAETFGTRDDETRLHRLFGAYRVRGEWFLPSLIIRELIEHLHDGGDLRVWLSGFDLPP
jgi:hypothetical protein